VSAGGLIATQGHVWDEGGHLLASGGAHLCCVDRTNANHNTEPHPS
jgi:hypothetical protein